MGTATFTIKVTGVKADKDTNIVKQLSWNILAEQEGVKIDVNYSTDVPDGVLGTVDALVEATTVAWIEANDIRIEGIKNHLQYQLNLQIPDTALVAITPSWAVSPDQTVE